MLKPFLIILFGLFLFSFTDGLDQCSIYLNQTMVGHWVEVDSAKTYTVKANLDRDTLRFEYWTDYGGEMHAKLELRTMNDSIIHFIPFGKYITSYGVYSFLLIKNKELIKKYNSFKVYVMQTNPYAKDTALAKTNYFVAILKFN